jgi:hypothetical protein
MRRELEKARRLGLIVAIYSDRNSPASSSVGYVSHLGRHVITLNAFTRDGQPDGVVLRRAANIFKVEVGDTYAQRLAALSKQRTHLESTASRGTAGEREENFYQALKRARSKQTVVSVWLKMDTDEAYMSGLVHSLSESEVLLNRLDDYGRPDGNVVFRIVDIEALDIGGVSERRLAFLHSSVKYDYSWPE